MAARILDDVRSDWRDAPRELMIIPIFTMSGCGNDTAIKHNLSSSNNAFEKVLPNRVMKIKYNPVEEKIERRVPVGIFRSGSFSTEARFDPINMPDKAGNIVPNSEKKVGVMPVLGSEL
mmetsp:Transcript_34274/g.79194  ORF Transcript_34274/g.79194 Transcript_34274/m.79194 type:complete len:119 (-) Transcript_34274:1046-1402(-)|eukprot:CAMPEP_0113304520 /NCGR_PEP_ID=MMETSP0010_2-20120614/4506_1 /TAXON_ID=216773 ORGANISM="Corethron hystrix, Strain 308" /NCGR_SAMPLE_ID=MMETSP0010_2 /ASSEMBLY_ACC=CAM_ASM_000155 /LENGTH=118 /DNA_ID=CAMNT_0000158739 /DNA_START=1583 /DNA_END=1939 /DNA_ORIENTATION=+ /assembly_acc=CAM_ASM_000155